MQRGGARAHDAEVLGDIQGWMARRWADLDRRGEPASNKIDRISLDEPEPLQQLMVGSWNRKALGWTDYGPLDRLNYGTSPLTKAVVGPILVGGTLEGGIDEEGLR